MLHQHKRSKKSKSDDWWTPKKVFKKLCKMYNFYPILDAAASNRNSLCKWYIDRHTNALVIDWMVKGKKVLVWLNPPNKQLGKFIARTYQQFTDHGIKTMMIVPLNVQSSKSWWRNVQEPKERGERIFVRPIEGRIPFKNHGYGSQSSINGYCVVIFGRRNKCTA